MVSPCVHKVTLPVLKINWWMMHFQFSLSPELRVLGCDTLHQWPLYHRTMVMSSEPGENLTGSGRTFRLHTEKPQARNQTHNLVGVWRLQQKY